MSIKQKIGGAMAIASLLAATLAPASALAATNISIFDNGFGSHNFVGSFSFTKKVVKQRNRTRVNTFVSSHSNTGGNHTSFNTDGTNSITTGSTNTGVAVGVTGNTNTNENSVDCCCDGDTTVDISENGAFSHNGVFVADKCINVVKQSNSTSINTTVYSTSNTGHNSSSFNTGGDNSIETGDTTTSVIVSVEGGTNTNN